MCRARKMATPYVTDETGECGAAGPGAVGPDPALWDGRRPPLHRAAPTRGPCGAGPRPFGGGCPHCLWGSVGSPDPPLPLTMGHLPRCCGAGSGQPRTPSPRSSWCPVGFVGRRRVPLGSVGCPMGCVDCLVGCPLQSMGLPADRGVSFRVPQGPCGSVGCPMVSVGCPRALLGCPISRADCAVPHREVHCLDTAPGWDVAEAAAGEGRLRAAGGGAGVSGGASVPSATRGVRPIASPPSPVTS